MTKDPVCGMQVDETKATETADFDGKKFYFCAAKCKETFNKDPKKYADGKSASNCCQ